MKPTVAFLALFTCTALAAAGPEWPEIGDAGPLPVSAQVVLGNGPLARITGNLTGTAPLPGRGADDFQDMYLIRIVDPINFVASTDMLLGGFANFNANLFLFSSDGRGLLGTLGIGTAATITSAADDGSGAELIAPGDYYIAISGGFSVPISGNGPIFDFVNPGELSGPDGPGGLDPIIDWIGPTQFGYYEIIFQGAAFVPAPSTLMLVLLSPLIARRQR